jgi:plastocyanin
MRDTRWTSDTFFRMRKLLIASLAVPTVVLCTLAAACSSSSSGGGTEPTSTTTTPTDAGTGVDTGPTATATSTADASVDLINGCTSLTDNTAAGVAAPGLNWGLTVSADVNRCSKIKVGQSVSWTGDFGQHPLAPHDSTGGSTANSPITNGSTTGQGTVTIAFPTAGTYGYWCTVHQTAMMGEIVVE